MVNIKLVYIYMHLLLQSAWNFPERPSHYLTFVSNYFLTDTVLMYLCAAFAWLKCEEGIVDCEKFLREKKNILTKSGKYFGDDLSYVRVSMLDRDSIFNTFIHRISSSFNSTL